MQRLLTTTEIQDFLTRNPQVASWNIPAWGMSVEDPVYGNVVVFQGADGNWYYSGWTTVSPSVINAPVYESGVGITAFGSPSAGAAPPCDPTTNDISGWLCSLGNTAQTALALAGAYFLYALLK